LTLASAAKKKRCPQASAVELLSVENDAINGPLMTKYLVMIG
jgi:hypothetical protein